MPPWILPSTVAAQTPQVISALGDTRKEILYKDHLKPVTFRVTLWVFYVA